MKKVLVGVLTIVAVLSLGLFVFGCSGSIDADYDDAMALQKAIDKGEEVTGKTVRFKVFAVIEETPESYIVPAAEFISFVSEKDPGVKEGDEVVFKVTGVDTGGYLYRVYYERLS